MRDVLKSMNLNFGIPYKYHFTNNKKYRSGCIAKNIALKLSKNPLIIINDPEVFHLDDKTIFKLKEHIRQNNRTFNVVGTMKFCNDIFNDFSKYSTINHSQAPFIASVMKSELLAVGGWDERFKFWGNDDNDLMYRLGLNGVRHQVFDELVAIHQWHPRPPVDAMGDANESLLYEKPKKIVANQGKEWGVINK